MIRLLPFVALLLALAVHAADPPKKEPPAGPTVIRLAKQAKAPPRALAYHLMPDPLEEVEGDASQLWLRAGMHIRALRHKWNDKEKEWMGWGESPRGKLPRKEVDTLLMQYLPGLALADRAALRTRCHWDYKPLTMQTISTTLPMDEIQAMRELINYIRLRLRFDLQAKQFDEARRSAQTGLALARHMGDSDLMIQDLVGLAIASIMVVQLEEWMQTPDSPNL